MTKRLLIFAVTSFSASALYGQCTASASGSSMAAAEINARMCATETFIAGAGGVTANTLVITDTSSPAKVIAATGSGAYGVALSTAIAGGSVQIQRYGEAQLVMENAATAGHLLTPGTSTVIDGHDSGQTSASAIAINTRIIGIVLTSASAGATATVELSPAHYGTLVLPSGTGVVNVTGGTAGLVSGTSTNCVLVNGSSAACGSGGGSGPGGNGASIWQGSGVSVSNTGTLNPFTFTTILHDTGSYANLGSHNDRLTVPSTGWYHVTFLLQTSNTSFTTGNVVGITPLVNGSPDPYGGPLTGITGTQFIGISNNYVPLFSITYDTYRTAGDYIGVSVYNGGVTSTFYGILSAMWVAQ